MSGVFAAVLVGLESFEERPSLREHFTGPGMSLFLSKAIFLRALLSWQKMRYRK